MKINIDTIEQWEEHAFYESGLSAHGCFEDLDDYAKQAIHKYGRLLLKSYEQHTQDLEVDVAERIKLIEKSIDQHEELIGRLEQITKQINENTARVR
jgi:DNA-directed RNA polymerase beta subunit